MKDVIRHSANDKGEEEMSLDLEFRNATAADWPAIETLLTTGGLPLDGAREHLDFFIVGVRGNAIRCVAGFELYGGVALLRSVAVSDALRGKGAGALLLDAIRAKAQAEGVEVLYLLTTTAAAFFGKRGFQQIERSSAPDVIKASREFQGVCPASATMMVASIGR
ncbi:arsenic resistance N-acetyltransferase ArsN2 [Pseudoduganella sp. S-14]|uniref:arsenic resistance N-acetyltransferase ArsN2 n=1 Tax=Pseudoduganella sp. S-14 TaxID=3404065 RepID=UPI003CE7517B